ncbi:MAG: sigma factor-like helix-turn-helix DNA-binding protein [Candidatus Fimenecus sp.]
MDLQMPDTPILLSGEDYVYLSECFEPLTADDFRNGAAAKYVVRRKTDTLGRLVRHALENELNEEERYIAKLLFIEGVSVSQAARICGITRQRVYTLSQKADSKLRACLQYPFLMDFSLVNPAKPFLQTLQQFGGNL